MPKDPSYAIIKAPGSAKFTTLSPTDVPKDSGYAIHRAPSLANFIPLGYTDVPKDPGYAIVKAPGSNKFTFLGSQTPPTIQTLLLMASLLVGSERPPYWASTPCSPALPRPPAPDSCSFLLTTGSTAPPRP